MNSTKNKKIYYLKDIGLSHNLSFPNTVGIRVDGLIGDNIVASTTFKNIIEKEKKQLVIFCTYNHEKTRIKLLADLYSELMFNGTIKCIIHYPRPHGPLTIKEKKYLKGIGCVKIYDCGPFEREFKNLKKDLPFLGKNLEKKWETKRSNKTVALFRWSGFHSHYQLRNRPYSEWEKIEGFLISRGFRCILFGIDDVLPNKNGLKDYRGKLTVYGTLKKMSECSLLISTTSFPPHFCQYFIPCLVLSDPGDVKNLKKKWGINNNFIVFDVNKKYLLQMKKFLSKFYN